MPKWYEKADFLLLPSLYEALPFTILEVMSMGVVILTSLYPSCTYLVDDENGILVNPLKVNEIKKGIEKLLKISEEEYSKKSENSLKRVRKFNKKKKMRRDICFFGI